MELINPDYKDFLDTELKLDACTLAPKFEGKDARVYLEKRLARIDEQSDLEIGALIYTNKKNQLRSIPIVAKIISHKKSPTSILSLNYEQDTYQYISQNILAKNIAPNFIGYVGKGKCQDASMLLTQFNGKQTLTEFLNSNKDDETVCSILFQCSYICLTLEHFRIQHNNINTDNIRVETLSKPVALCYAINDQRYVVNTNHVVYIHNWGLAYCESLGINGSIPNSYRACFVDNQMIHKRDFCNIMSSIIISNKESRLLKDTYKYLKDTFTNSLLCTIQTFEPFYRYLNVSPTAKQVFCFGQNIIFEHVTNNLPEYKMCCVTDVADMNNYRPLIANVEHVKYYECNNQFTYPYTFKNTKSFTFIQYGEKLESLELLLSRLSNTDLKQLTLFIDTNIDNLFELLAKYTKSVEKLTVISTTPHNNSKDLQYIGKLRLSNMSVTMKNDYYKNDPHFRSMWAVVKPYDRGSFYDENRVMTKMYNFLKIQTLSDVVMYMKAIYLFFAVLSESLRVTDTVDLFRYSEDQLFISCVYYIFERPEIFDQYPEISKCYKDVVWCITLMKTSIADIPIPLDYLYLVVYGLSCRYISPNADIFKRACFAACNEICNVIVPQPYRVGTSFMDIVRVSLGKAGGDEYIKFITYN